MSRRTRRDCFSTKSPWGRRRLRLEPLEDRRMLAAVVVGNTLNLVNGDTSSIDALIASPGADGISLREALLATNATAGDDAISFAPGIVGGQINTGGVALPTITDNLTLQGPIIIDCWNGFSRGFTIAAGADVTITGFQIRNGFSEFGGAIHNSGTLSLIDCDLNTNLADFGGAIYNAPGAQLSATGTVLRFNEATIDGGAIYNSGTLTLSHSQRGYSAFNSFRQGADEKGILENKAGQNGGAIYNSFGSVLSVTDVSIIWNNAENLAGGIFNEGTATVHGIIGQTSVGEGYGTYYYSAISYNSAYFVGAGGIFNTGTFTLNGASVLNNSGGLGGGGSVLNGGTLTIVNSTLGKNLGIAIRNSGTATVTNSNVYGTVGVGILNEAAGTLTINNTIVAASTSGDIANSGTLSGSHNFVGDGSGAELIGTLTGDPKLQPLEPIYYPNPTSPINHGPVPIMLPLAGSPLIDGGDSSLVPSGILVDQRGVTRIKQGVVDIGTVEFGAETLTVTTLVDENDHTLDPSFGTGTSLREALAHVNELEPFDEVTIVFAPGVTGTISLIQTPLPTLTDLAGLTIVGPGDDLLTIDGSAVQGENGGILEMRTSVVTISGLTFANGTASGTGGAIYAGGNITLVDCSFVGNSANGGGGAVYARTSFVATGCDFSFNAANVNELFHYEGGGAIFNDSVMLLTGCTFTENTAFMGGAIQNILTDFWEFHPNTPMVTGCTFSGNSAVSEGGAIANIGGQYLARLKVTGSTFFQNTAGERGGGIYSEGILTVDSSTLYGNSAASMSPSPVAGGGIEIGRYDTSYSSYTTLNNSIVAGSISGYDVYVLPVATVSVSGGFNLIGDGSGGLPNTITGDPLLGPLQDNGGPTWTMAPLTGSAAIDRGSYAAFPQPLTAPSGVMVTLVPGAGDLPSHTTYTVRIAATTRFGESEASAAVSITTGSSADSLHIVWNAVPGASRYKVYVGIQGQQQNLVQDDSSTASGFNGFNAYFGTAPETNTAAIPEVDQRGLARIIGNSIDIGAVERQTPQLVGDFNRDGMVNAADYTVWRDALGSSVANAYFGADGNGDSTVDADDYATWKAHFGTTLQVGVGSGAGSGAASPAVTQPVVRQQEVVAPVTMPAIVAPVESSVASQIAIPRAFDWTLFNVRSTERDPIASQSRWTNRRVVAQMFDDQLLLLLASNQVEQSSHSAPAMSLVSCESDQIDASSTLPSGLAVAFTSDR